ncbi:MAG: multicopper oxidase domain-containing protein, partial [Nitrospiraceae bacterium]
MYILWHVAAAAFLTFCCFTGLFPQQSFGAEPVIQAQLTTAPQVPPSISRSKPARVVVRLEAKEFIGPLADGVQYKFWSFNGTVPGPMIRVRVGDTVELHLKNAEQNKFPHNIDLHAVNGPGG